MTLHLIPYSRVLNYYQQHLKLDTSEILKCTEVKFVVDGKIASHIIGIYLLSIVVTFFLTTL